MQGSTFPEAITASDAPARLKPSTYPEPFASRMAGRVKRPLGDVFGLTNFGVNLTRLAPGAQSALRHAHSQQDEFLYVLAGTPTLIADVGETLLSPGCVISGRRLAGDFGCGRHVAVCAQGRHAVLTRSGDRTLAFEGSTRVSKRFAWVCA